MTPLFLLSPAPRCGTNFLYDLLLLHEKVKASSVDESYLLESLPLLNPFIHRIIGHSSSFALVHDDAQELLRVKVIESVLNVFVPPPDGRSEQPGDGFLLIKTPSTRGLPQASCAPSNSRFLIVVRDGSDVIESTLRSFPWINMSYAVTRLRCGYESLNAARVEMGERLLIVRFEDLVKKPVDTIERILNWLGLDSNLYQWQLQSKLQPRGSSQSVSQNGEVSWDPAALENQAFNPINRAANWDDVRKLRYRLQIGSLERPYEYPIDESQFTFIIQIMAWISHFSDSVKYRLLRSFKKFALSDLGFPPPLWIKKR